MAHRATLSSSDKTPSKQKKAHVSWRVNKEKAEDMNAMSQELGLNNRSEFLDKATDTFMYHLDLGLRKQLEIKLKMLENKQERRLQALEERYELEKKQIIDDSQSDIDFIKQTLEINLKENCVAPNKEIMSEEDLIESVYEDLKRLYGRGEFDGENCPEFYITLLNKRLKSGTDYCKSVVNTTIKNSVFY